VVLASKSALKELLHYCAQRMGAYKVPVRIVAVAEMPKNPMGKILKRELKQTLFRQIYANGSNP
jgi:acyl-coenzyme A synthetase/AMP-(fatty) acid ligase